MAESGVVFTPAIILLVSGNSGGNPGGQGVVKKVRVRAVSSCAHPRRGFNHCGFFARMRKMRGGEDKQCHTTHCCHLGKEVTPVGHHARFNGVDIKPILSQKTTENIYIDIYIYMSARLLCLTHHS